MAEKSQVVIVVWDDAHGSATSDVTIGDLPHKPCAMTTLGWLLKENNDGVSIASERYVWDGEEYYRGHNFIPKGMIRSVTPFTLTRPRRKKAPHEEVSPSG